MTTMLAFLGPIGYQELIIIAVIGLLIFGKRLPEVGRSLGKGIVEFKKGLAGIEDEVQKGADEQKPSPPEKLDDNKTSDTVDAKTSNTKTQA